MHEDATTTPPEYDDWAPAPYEEDLPPRPRRRLVTPVTLGLTAVLLAAGGFLAGVEVQKHQGGSTPVAASVAGAGARAGAGAGQGGGGFAFGRGGGGPLAGATFGTVTSKRGSSTLYVRSQSGTTVRVHVDPHAQVSRTASTSAAAIHPGDTVVVMGARHGATVAATSVRATASGAGGGPFGGGGGFGGFRGLGGGGGGGAGG